jgi:hypothetical protein
MGRARTGSQLTCLKCGMTTGLILCGDLDGVDDMEESRCVFCGGTTVFAGAVHIEGEWRESGFWFWLRRVLYYEWF